MFRRVKGTVYVVGEPLFDDSKMETVLLGG
jgi:hypothetical protein